MNRPPARPGATAVLVALVGWVVAGVAGLAVVLDATGARAHPEVTGEGTVAIDACRVADVGRHLCTGRVLTWSGGGDVAPGDRITVDSADRLAAEVAVVSREVGESHLNKRKETVHTTETVLMPRDERVLSNPARVGIVVGFGVLWLVLAVALVRLVRRRGRGSR